MKCSFLLYTKKGCGYSQNAVELLQKHQIEFEQIFVDPIEKNELFTKLRPLIGQYNTFPLIFVNDSFLGGFTELEQYINQNFLMLKIPQANKVKKTKFKGSPYLSFIAMCYLSNKHQNCCVVIPNCKYPKSHEEISLRWNEENNEISVPPNFWSRFNKCNSKKKRFIVFPFGFTCRGSGHANYMIYDTVKKSMERFEPYGEILNIYDKSLLPCVNAPVDHAIKELFSKEMGESFIKQYYSPLEFCPELSFQTLQEQEKYIKSDPDGFCSAWSCWYTDLRLLNPDVSSEILVTNTIKQLKKSPEKLTDFIRNYSSFIVDVSKIIKCQE
jgi:glutaredoxin